MGGRTPDATDWSAIASYTRSSAAAPSFAQVYTAQTIHPDLDPRGFMIRESRHSPANPKSTPIMLGLDITGSMGQVAHLIAAGGLETLVTEIFSRKPVSDPHIAFAGIGDVLADGYPKCLQVSQFESDMIMIDQLKKLWVAGGGGGNMSESYTLLWHAALFHTRTDAYEKDGRKGFLFTFGDDGVPPDLTQAALREVYGRDDEIVMSNEDMLAEVSKMYHVFHINIEHDGCKLGQHLEAGWQKILGERFLNLTDYTKLSEVIVSVMQVVAGADKQAVVDSWQGGTGLVVKQTISGLSTVHGKSSVVRF